MPVKKPLCRMVALRLSPTVKASFAYVLGEAHWVRAAKSLGIQIV